MKHIQDFENFLNEETIKSKSDLDFIKKIISVIEKEGLKVILDEKKGMITIKGGDDENVSFEYRY